MEKKIKKFRVPRKLKKQIPGSYYCYTGLNYDDVSGIYHIKPCPFYSHIKIKDIPKESQLVDEEDYVKEFGDYVVGWCKLIKYEIDDQCKSCSYNKPKYK